MQKIALDLSGTSVADMLRAQDPGDGWVMDIEAIGRGQIGVLHRRDDPAMVRAGIGPGLKRLGDDIIAFSGLPLDPARIASLSCARDLVTMMPDCDGYFAAVGWSAAEKRLYVVGDFLGLQPLYYQIDANSLRLATETKAFPYTPDPAGWGAWMACQYVIGDRTLNRGVARLGVGSTVVIDADRPRWEPRRYWHWPQVAPQTPDLDAVLEPLRRNLADYAAIVPDATVLVSGGFDSRLIVGLLAESGRHPPAMGMTHRNQNFDMDHSLAKKVASAAGLKLAVTNPADDFFSTRAYLDYVWANEGATPSLYLYISQLQQFLGGLPGIWEGLIPAHTLRNVHQPAGGFAAMRREEFLPEDHPYWQAAKQIMQPAFYGAMRNDFLALLDRTVAAHDDNDTGTWQLIVENRMRNRTGPNPAKVYAQKTTPLILGTSQALWQAVAPMPHDERNYRFYLRLMDATFPKLARYPFDSAGELFVGRHARLWGIYYKAHQCFSNTMFARPKIAKLLSAEPFVWPASRFLEAPAILDEDDPCLNMDALRALRRQGSLPKSIARLLFHWRAARWVHEGRLHATLIPNA